METKTKVQLQFVNHIQAGMAEQDVYVPVGDGRQVARVDGDAAKSTAALAGAIYAAATPVPHDPFRLGPNPVGPYPKGGRLPVTLGQWLSASGSGAYEPEGEGAKLQFAFKGLVPQGVYTLWASRLTMPPTPRIADSPAGPPDGSRNSFRADAQGNAAVTIETAALLPSSKETVSMFSIVYHSDGRTHGREQGEIGRNAHLHLFSMIPPPA